MFKDISFIGYWGRLKFKISVFCFLKTSRLFTQRTSVVTYKREAGFWPNTPLSLYIILLFIQTPDTIYYSSNI